MFKKIETLTGIAASFLLFLLMVITFIDVIGRNFLNRPLPGGSELTEIVLAGSIFFLLPSVAFRGDHIVVDLIDVIRTPLLDFIRKLLVGILGGALFALIAWRLWILGGMALGYADRTPTLGIPLAPVIFAMSILAGITALCFVALLFRRDIHIGNAELERMLEAEGIGADGVTGAKSEKEH
ncbi:TRAP transporter small permease [Ruixingdingia sedimenti]|uniref:TRAP transporter small permease protein n=1 Tax=Ruixingdingia sedimenti TaxID=3073604 RepID=A0ABU1F2V2_9RHOB|nr:TRAP transporter small permease [Xinfangfangia sp. LG-4]MDR5651186.1 TRAP transporter small permease [Xinfangfangia sp. LG-4]